MTRMTPRETRLLWLAAILYGAVAISTGMRRGGDLEAHFTAARLWIEGAQLYAHPPKAGVWCHRLRCCSSCRSHSRPS